MKGKVNGFVTGEGDWGSRTAECRGLVKVDYGGMSDIWRRVKGHRGCVGEYSRGAVVSDYVTKVRLAGAVDWRTGWWECTLGDGSML